MAKEKVKLTVTMDNLTVPQALALSAMFKYWEQCGKWGMTREVGFYVDGDGNFRPNIEMQSDVELPTLTKELEDIAVARDRGGDRLYDYDTIAGILRGD